MPENASSQPLFLLLVSFLVLAAISVKIAAGRLRIPPAVGYIGVGLALRVFDDRYGLLGTEPLWALHFLAQLGVVSLLFHVGLRSNLSGLLQQLPRASGVWVSDVIVSSVVGFLACRWLGFGLLPSLFAGAALSATSVGISVTVWEDAGAIKSKLAELLLDVAELDDLSAIVLLLIAVAATPLLLDGGSGAAVVEAVAAAGGMLLLKLLLFVMGCWAFSAFAEPWITSYFAKFRRAPDPLMVIVGFGFGIAALAGWLGFSVAVGALFAGLMFSRDPKAVRLDGRFETIYALFSPFFFIDIGYAFDPQALRSAMHLGLFLFVAAVMGKLFGAGLPLVFREGLRPAIVLGISMAPRAEIALLVARTGADLGPQVVSKELYGAIVLACALASVASPLVLHRLLRQWPETVGQS